MRRLGLMVLVVAGAAASATQAQPPACQVDTAGMITVQALPSVAAAIREKQPLEVVVVGTGSSTTGRAAVGREASYADRLKDELMGRFPGVAVGLINLSERGLTARQMLERLSAEVTRHPPTLVIWQTGTTELARGLDLNEFGEAAAEGLDLLHERGVDVVLINPQYSPKSELVLDYEPVLDHMARVADSRNVMVFPRYQIMRQYAEEGRFHPDARSAPQQSQEANWLHRCLAVGLAELIAAAVAASGP